MSDIRPDPPSTPLLAVEKLKVHFPVHEGVLRRREIGAVRAVDGISFQLKRGETFSLVGESGCGKSTTALAVLRMQASTAGRILFDGEDITHFTPVQMRAIRRRMQMVYQDPFGSLNPRMKIRDIIGEPLTVHALAGDKPAFRRRIDELMALVGLLPDMADRYPHEFSGGQRQRIGIARALALDPELVICDEAVSALDVSIQAQVLNLLMDLQDQLGLTYLFISHDLSVVRHISDRIGVMYLGRLVEIADRDDLFDRPRHPYTQALLGAVPVPDPVVESSRAAQIIPGEVPSVRNPPSGCRFHTRCPRAMSQCRIVEPPEIALEKDRRVACHLFP
ncbi:MAG: ATP-binding cassette domain-containing protein [Pseudomonadales bacterium]|nr:ATP-binding cassette domain-containing protein [Pseudomonadales bacterium]